MKFKNRLERIVVELRSIPNRFGLRLRRNSTSRVNKSDLKACKRRESVRDETKPTHVKRRLCQHWFVRLGKRSDSEPLSGWLLLGGFRAGALIDDALLVDCWIRRDVHFKPFSIRSYHRTPCLISCLRLSCFSWNSSSSSTTVFCLLFQFSTAVLACIQLLVLAHSPQLRFLATPS